MNAAGAPGAGKVVGGTVIGAVSGAAAVVGIGGAVVTAAPSAGEVAAGGGPWVSSPSEEAEFDGRVAFAAMAVTAAAAATVAVPTTMTWRRDIFGSTMTISKDLRATTTSTTQAVSHNTAPTADTTDDPGCQRKTVSGCITGYGMSLLRGASPRCNVRAGVCGSSRP